MATSLSVGAAERNVRSVLSGKEEEEYVNLFQGFQSDFIKQCYICLFGLMNQQCHPSPSSHNLQSPNASLTDSKQQNKQVSKH